MPRITFTHGYDTVLAFPRFIIGIAWFLVVLGALDLLKEPLAAVGIGPSSLEGLPHWVKFVAYMVLFIALLALAMYIHIKTTNRWIGILSAWLYITRTLRTDISLTDTAGIYWLFVPNETGSWYPMTEVLQIPRERRREYILGKAATAAAQMSEQKPSAKQRH